MLHGCAPLLLTSLVRILELAYAAFCPLQGNRLLDRLAPLLRQRGLEASDSDAVHSSHRVLHTEAVPQGAARLLEGAAEALLVESELDLSGGELLRCHTHSLPHLMMSLRLVLNAILGGHLGLLRFLHRDPLNVLLPLQGGDLGVHRSLQLCQSCPPLIHSSLRNLLFGLDSSQARFYRGRLAPELGLGLAALRVEVLGPGALDVGLLPPVVELHLQVVRLVPPGVNIRPEILLGAANCLLAGEGGVL
mmetsp:Transcript_28202/g.80967  ORF Transcript_28202/g.80967 Transcript_28202/m.80967 type:complete len:248 (+) Transcript_28202:657-1400(+)